MALFAAKTPLTRLSRWRRLLEKLVPVSVSYRPERHYMRGPGPKYREKHPSYGAPDDSIPARSAPRRQIMLPGSGEPPRPAISPRG